MLMSSRATHKLGQLWQLPLLLLSLVLFAVSGYLFLNASPGLTVRRRVEIARAYIDHERPEAALQQLNRLLTGERMTQDNEASVHLLIAQALDSAQQQRKINIPANHLRIIEQTQLAMQMGVKSTSDIHRRLGDSFVALGRTEDAISAFRLAATMDPSRALHLRKKIVEVKTYQGDSASAAGGAAAMAALDDYLASKDIADAERAWGLGEKSQILADRGDFVAARALIADAMKLDTDPLVQAQANYRMAYCAWKLNKLDDAEKLAHQARDQFHGQHPLDADAAYLLARLRQEQNDLPGALAFYEVVVQEYPESRYLLPARLGQADCYVHSAQEPLGLSELRKLVTVLAAQPPNTSLRDQAVKTLRTTSQLLVGKLNFDHALIALDLEKSLTPNPAADLYSRVALAAQKRAEQIELIAADASPAERPRHDQSIRDLLNRAAEAQIQVARATSDIKPFWAAIDLYTRAKNPTAATTAIELFASERPNDAGTADVLQKLAEMYSAAGANEKALVAYKQLHSKFPTSPAAQRCILPFARAYIATGAAGYPSAERLLTEYHDRNDAAKIATPETRQASLELASLLYRTDQYEKAITILQPLLAQSQDQDLADHATFIAADSYRKTAIAIEAKIVSTASAPVAADLTAAAARKKDLLVKARGLYDQVVTRYQKSTATRDDQRQWERQSYFYRGDCAYEIGNYPEAISLYEAAAKRYQQEPAALAAFVQIVNSNWALGKTDDARIANDKAKTLLRNLPAEAFNNGSFTMPKSYWEQWLKWNSMAGAW
jgi:tetratricopeptide (TPR) repeat protein